jgi:hypothetical protein
MRSLNYEAHAMPSEHCCTFTTSTERDTVRVVKESWRPSLSASHPCFLRDALADTHPPTRRTSTLDPASSTICFYPLYGLHLDSYHFSH